MLFVWLGVFLSAQVVNAAEPDRPLITFNIENDSLIGTDRHYTHGTRLAYYHTGDRMPLWTSNMLASLSLGMQVESRRLGFAIGQNIYTPEKISERRFIPDDRPYAGWLYGGFILQRRGLAREGRVAIRDYLELDFGVVGPESISEETQTWWHGIVDAPRPEGWDHQLQTEPGVVLSMDRAWRYPGTLRPGWSADVIPEAGVTLGNIMTYGSVGAMIRAGYHLPETFSPGGLYQPTLHVPVPPGNDHLNWGVYLFGGVDGRVVVRNIFLDGNTWRDSHSMEKEHLVADLKAGFAFYVSRFSTSMTYVFRSREFREQKGANQYASLSLGWQF